jgi:acylphosphatase
MTLRLSWLTQDRKFAIVDGFMRADGFDLLRAGKPRTMGTKLVRYNVQFVGRVQGVGFRYTTAQIARRYNVAGYVKNLSDGSVELVVEGAASDVHSFLDELNQDMKDNIQKVYQHEHPANGEFTKFEVRFE